MEKINRTITPNFLQTNYKRWCWQWSDLKNRNQGAQFHWYQHQNQLVNHLLLPYLQAITNYHCSFCDQKNLIDSVIEPTVEHFKPKSKYPLLSYFWHNLFLCCNSCQKKLERYYPDLLKPDRPSYDFDSFFSINWATGHIESIYNEPDPRYYAATHTIELYSLNKGGKPQARKKELDLYLDSRNPDIEDFSYRFYIRRGL